MKIRYQIILFILLVMPAFTSCKRNPYKVRTASIKADIEIKRLEKDLFSLNPEEITRKGA